MIKIDKLNLMCDKLQIVLSFNACIFLCGETDGTPNVLFFLDLLSMMRTSAIDFDKRRIWYKVMPGQADASFLSLSDRWKIGIKATRRLMKDFEERGLLCMAKSNTTTIVSMVCVKNWYAGGSYFANPVFKTSVDRQEGAFIYLINGQQIPHIRANRKKPKRKGTNGTDPTLEEELSEGADKDCFVEDSTHAPQAIVHQSSNVDAGSSVSAEPLPLNMPEPSADAQ